MRLCSIRLVLGFAYVAGVGGLVGGLVGCAPGGGFGAQQSGAALFRQNCVVCHGVSGVGDGAMARDLPVPPANLRTLSVDNGGVFPATQVMAAIYGYRGKGAEALMPEFGPILDSPTVIWTSPSGQQIATPSALVALANYLETLQDL